jgi:DNA-binding transcriptional LysR family regulator
VRFSLSNLRVFAVVADLGSITLAAERLGRTPSTVSMALKQLEEELGTKLFASERKNRLSPAGQFVREHAADLVSHYERAVRSMQAYVRNQTGRVDVACVRTVATEFLPEVILNFRRKHPGVDINMLDADSQTIISAVETGKVGLGIGSLRHPRPDLRFEPLFDDALGIVCRHDDPLASLTLSPSWQALDGRLVIGNGITDLVGIEEFIKPVSVTAYGVLTLLALVKAGIGVTVLPRLSVPANEKEVAFVPIDHQSARRGVGLITRTPGRPSPAAAAFIAELHRVVTARAAMLDLHLQFGEAS